ncbi:MAG: DUF4348 domain-containing protein [Prevotellaceae bacterium]|nr:DUF4348 domain-containing protein [Prevotellaceae bacterium]
MSARYLSIAAACLPMAFLLSCTGRGKTTGGDEEEADLQWAEEGDTEDEDWDEGDEFAGEERQAAEPLSFNDFFFLFLRSKAYQAAHIKFPLDIEELDETVRTISSGAAFRQYFLWPSDDDYTLLLTDLEEMEALGTPLSLDSVSAEVIDLEAMTMRTYDFYCTDSVWQLRRSRNTEPRRRYGDFLRFYAQFSRDTLFQQERLAEEIRFSSADPDDETQLIEGILLPSQWQAFRPQLPEGVITNLVFGQPYDDTKRITLVECGFATSMMQTVTFEQRHGRWLLTSFDD